MAYVCTAPNRYLHARRLKDIKSLLHADIQRPDPFITKRPPFFPFLWGEGAWRLGYMPYD